MENTTRIEYARALTHYTTYCMTHLDTVLIEMRKEGMECTLASLILGCRKTVAHLSVLDSGKCRFSPNRIPCATKHVYREGR